MGIGIIGIGHVGCALAADMSSRGYQPLLWAHPEHRRVFNKILEHGSHIEADGAVTGRFRVETTLSLSTLVRSTHMLLVAVPSQAHDELLMLLKKEDLSHHAIIFITGNAVSVLAGKHLNTKFILETPTSAYSSRVNDEAKVQVRAVKRRLQIASLQQPVPALLCNELESLLDIPLEWRTSALDVFFSGVNGVVHVTTALLNSGWAEASGGDFYFYRDGMQPGVCAAIEAADAERLAVAAAYGFRVDSAVDTYNANYGADELCLRDFARCTEPHNQAKGAQTRFLSQDVPFWLVLCSDLGARAGVPTPVIDSLVQIASVLKGEAFRAQGRTLPALGLGGASVLGVLEAFGCGGRSLKVGSRRRSLPARSRPPNIPRRCSHR